jgi:prepilin-type N-terminal cleavage/methylation domain-containing protein
MLKNKKGFSLVELTVVVLIMAILAAIALPQYRSTVERTRIITHIGTLKALQDAVIQYYPQNNEFPKRLRQLHVGVPEKDWNYSGLQVLKRDNSGYIQLHDTDNAGSGKERITFYSNHSGKEDWKIDFDFVINSTGLAPAGKFFEITSGDTGRINTLTRTVESMGWVKTGNRYAINK